MKKKNTKNHTNKAGTNSLQPTRNIVPKAIARTRSDVLVWKNALSNAENIDY